MIVYHGSNSNFKSLRINKKLVKRKSTLENEGLGIYFSTDINVATEYGKYIYTLEVNDSYFLDFRKKKVCESYIQKIVASIYNKIGIDISVYINLYVTITYLQCGGIAISGLGRELYLQLDSNSDWYSLPKTKIDAVYRMLRMFDKNCPKVYMFTYHIKNIGIIKDVSDDVVRIICKEHR